MLRKTLLGIVTASVAAISLSTAAFAHGDHGESGLYHMLSTFNHGLPFVLIGCLIALAILTQSNKLLRNANGALIVLMVIQGLTHGLHSGFSYGLEVFLTGGLIAVLVWNSSFAVLSLVQTTDIIPQKNQN